MAIKKLKAYFFAILVLSYLLVNSNQNYMEMRNCSIRRKTWTEKNRKKNEKGIRSSVDYAKKPSTTTIGQIKIRNITAIMSRVNDQFLFTLPLNLFTTVSKNRAQTSKKPAAIITVIIIIIILLFPSEVLLLLSIFLILLYFSHY